jgi:predicted nucleotidyltransferase
LDKKKAREIAVQYSNEVKEVLNPDKIVFFGSSINGTPHNESDIDIAIFMNDLSDETWYNVRILLQRLCRNKVFMDIEPHLLNETNDASGFAQHVLKTGEVL